MRSGGALDFGKAQMFLIRCGKKVRIKPDDGATEMALQPWDVICVGDVPEHF